MPWLLSNCKLKEMLYEGGKTYEKSPCIHHDDGVGIGVTAVVSPTATFGENLTLEQLKNGTYQGIYDHPVQLTEGIYEGKPFVEGGALRPTVTFIDELSAAGDLNGDGSVFPGGTYC